jgi:hypothetical protein
MKVYLFGLLSGALMLGGILIPYIWPPELSLILNSSFWVSALGLVNAFILVSFLYIKGPSSEKAFFLFSFMLILSAAQMYTGFEEIAINIKTWKPHFEESYTSLFVYLHLFISYAKNIIAFGFAAIGASLCASIIAYRFYKHT